MTRLPANRRSNWQVFRWPLAIAAVSLVGLLSALVGDGWHDLLSWTALGTVLAALIAAWRGWFNRQA